MRGGLIGGMMRRIFAAAGVVAGLLYPSEGRALDQDDAVLMAQYKACAMPAILALDDQVSPADVIARAVVTQCASVQWRIEHELARRTGASEDSIQAFLAREVSQGNVVAVQRVTIMVLQERAERRAEQH